MSTWRILVTVLLLIHPALSKRITTTCEIPSVEEGDNTTLTIHFGQDLRQEGVRDFSVEHIGHSSTASQTRLVDCEFSYGNVTCKKTSCCTWESHVTDIFRVYIYNVSQELEGRFWGFVIPASTEYQKSCNFSLKASTCRTDHIISTNSRVFCTNQPVTIGQTCTVTCNPDHYFQENHTSVTYTCVGKNKWSPEMMFIACKEQPKGQETSNSMIGISMAFLIVAGIGIVLVFIWYKWKRRQKWKKRTREVETNWLEFIRKWYPDLQSCTYFLPPLHFNRVLCCKQSVAGNLAPMLHTPQFLRECLGAESVDLAVKLCLLKDQLSDNQTPSDNNPSFLQALREWWQHVVMVSRSESLLRSSLYEQLVARFCGSATTVKVHCVTAPRLNITTLGKGVSETGERVDRIVLFPQQVDILNQSPPRAFLSGPPGTGKTIVLIMQGLTWLQRGYDIHVISTCDESRAATIVIEHQLQETAKTSTAKSRVYRHQFDLTEDGEVETAVSCLKSLYEGRQLCVIADDAVRDDRKPFSEFCDQLIKEVRGVFIWGASMYHDVIPECLKEFKLTTPLRSPPVVVREVMESLQIKKYKQVHDYTVNDVPVPTDGPPVMRIEHLDGQLGHTGDWPSDCVECGREVAHVLTELNVGRTGDSNGPPHLQYGDVLVLCDDYPTDDRVDSNGQVTTASGLVRGLHDCHVPVRVVEKDDVDAIRDMALGVGDLVTVAFWGDVRGLERKVVVVESGPEWFDRLHTMSRCTSQLVVIKYCPV